MRPAMHKSMVKGGWFAGVYLAISLARMVYAQDTPTQNQIYLPPAFGGTAYSFGVEAEAKYIAAQGAFLESAAIARKVNAEAVALELKNWVDYVDDYFKRRELNRQWREKERGGNYQDHLAKLEEAEKKRVNQLFQSTLQGDVTRELNWLLRELSGPAMAVQYTSREAIASFDAPLRPEDLKQIILTDGGRGGNKLVFSASGGKPLDIPWPYALGRPEFDKDRKEFEASRDAVVQEIQEKGRTGQKNGEQMWKTVNQLLVTLENSYPEEVRKNPTVFLEYSASKGFVQSLIGQTNRALTTNDRSVFDGSLQFKGKTVVDLVEHMCQRGMMFDRPQPGGEGVYSSLFEKMRNLYLTLDSTKKASEEMKPVKNDGDR
jgi:hypothetical protein